MRIVTPLPIEEARSRVRSSIRRHRVTIPFRRPVPSGLVGRMSGDTVELRTASFWRGRFWIRCSFRESPQETVVELQPLGASGRIRMLTPSIVAFVVMVISAVFTVRVAMEGFDERTVVMLSLTGFSFVVCAVAAYFGSLPVPTGPEMEDIEQLREMLDGRVEDAGLDRAAS